MFLSLESYKDLSVLTKITIILYQNDSNITSSGKASFIGIKDGDHCYSLRHFLRDIFTNQRLVQYACLLSQSNSVLCQLVN